MLNRKLIVATLFAIWTNLFATDISSETLSGKELLEIVADSSKEGKDFVNSLSGIEKARTEAFAISLQKNMMNHSDLKGDAFKNSFISNILENKIFVKESKREVKFDMPSQSTQINFAYVPFEQGMDFGTSYNDLADTTQRSLICFDGNFSLTRPVFRGVKTYDIKIVDSLEELQDALGLQASISLEMSQIEGTLSGLYESYKAKLNENVLVILSVEYQAYDYSLENPGLSSSARAMYGSAEQFEDFRIKCGDRYLSTITTGGLYMGFMEIMTQSEEEQKEIGAALEGNIDMGSVKVEISGEISSVMANIEENHNTKIQIYSKGGKAEQKLITTTEDFYASAETFFESLNPMNDPDFPYQDGAYLAKFSTYDTITIEKKGGDIIIANARMNEYRYYASVYDNYIYQIDYIQSNYDEYENAEEKDEVLRDLKKQLVIQKSQISGLARTCALLTIIGEETPSIDEKCPNPSTVTDDDGNKKFLDEWDILEILPLEKLEYPRTCKERKEMFQLESDGTYRVYMEGNKSKPYDIYCDGMGTEEPQEYLTLKNLSPVSDHPSYNYSRYASFYNVEDLETQNDLVSIYEKLKVKVSYDHIAVHDEQDKFFETVGGVVTADKNEIDDNSTISTALYGNARNLSREAEGEANINTAGTQFRLSEKTTFVQVKNGEEAEASYKLIQTPMSWTEAETYAVSLGGHLVTIDSASKNLEVMNFLKSEEVTELWIGLNTLQFENQLEWVAPNTFYDYSAWTTNEPSNDSSKECVSMDTTDEYRWARVNCSEEKNFLIEFSSDVAEATVEIDAPRTDIYFNSTGENGHIRSKNDLIFEYY